MNSLFDEIPGTSHTLWFFYIAMDAASLSLVIYLIT